MGETALEKTCVMSVIGGTLPRNTITIAFKVNSLKLASESLNWKTK
jgi:hypothetical protein